MDHKRWKQVDWLFHEALELSVSARNAFLKGSASDDAVVDEVNRLLQLHETAGDFLESPEPSVRDSNDQGEPNSYTAGDVIDRFRLLSRVGIGGMGEVWLAERADRLFDQKVALKIIRSRHPTSDSFRRFVNERQTLARLEHPYITRLIDGGATTDGRPYFVMEWVDGVTIDRFCNEQSLNLRSVLQLFLQVCEAVQFAHQHFVIHRDIKPGNVLISIDGRPKLLDFGIANLMAMRQEHEDRFSMGFTPEYASPEQVRGETCTTASDVYSLGVLLRNLVYPHQGRNPQGCITQIAKARHENTALVIQPAERGRHGDLDLILTKATAFDHRQRYLSVSELTDDVFRYLKVLPVAAHPRYVSYRIRRYLRRNALYCTLAAMAVISLLASTIVAINSHQKTRYERDAALAATAFLESVIGTTSPYQLGHDPTVNDLLESASRKANTILVDRPEVEFRVRMTLVRAHVAMWNWRVVVGESSRALDLATRLFGARSAEAAECMTVLGRAQTWLRKEEAVAMQRQALAIRQSIFTENHPAVAETLINLGFATWWTARPPRYEEADSLYRQGIAAYHAGGSHDSPDYARALYSYANFLVERGERRTEMLSAAKEAVQCFKRLHGAPDRYSTSALFLYGSLLIEEGQAGEGHAMLREFVSQVPKELSDEVMLHMAYSRIGYVELLNGNEQVAFEAFRRGIELDCRWRGSHGHDPVVWNSLADDTVKALNVDALVPVIERIQSQIEATAQPDDLQLMDRLMSITTLSGLTENPKLLINLAIQLRDSSQRLFPRSHYIRDSALAALGHLSLVENNHEDARRQLEQALHDLRLRRGQYDPYAQLALKDLIQMSRLECDEASVTGLARLATNLECSHE